MREYLKEMEGMLVDTQGLIALSKSVRTGQTAGFVPVSAPFP
jgi:hypothetical protein